MLKFVHVYTLIQNESCHDANLKVVIMTTVCATSEDEIGIMI